MAENFTKIIEGLNISLSNFGFSVNKDEVKKIYFKDGVIYIWND